MPPNSQPCRIVFSTGPDRGKVFEIDSELTHIGRAAENEVILDDPSLPDHQASILRKNGRFAIYRPQGTELQVDGADIPVEQWVWLPPDVRLQFGRRTSCQLTYDQLLSDEDDKSNSLPAVAKPKLREQAEKKVPPPITAGSPEKQPVEGNSDNSEDEGASGETPTKQRRKKKREGKRKSRPGKRKNVARFITDQGGPLVELGADGNLPELSLEDDPARKEKSDQPKQSNTAILYAALGLSFLASLAMLFADPDTTSNSDMTKADAREDIVRFFGAGDNDDELERWRRLLRSARLARSSGDYKTEVRRYRQVLELLRSEDRDPHIGITGRLTDDEELSKLIGVIISQ